ncbi:hypothetical protein QF021_003747 [Acidovorax delafieldii]|uniref:HipA family kinase n=1 Tax=Acidovorax delafieldii TaxID=47920 RepID=UPI00285AD319|nr:HipA family kinase [Acidovorax delafieldii]MDR6155658.1 hypothetical protein [Acidovorax delafieldii]
MQTSLLPIRITREVDAHAEGYEGNDLKRLAFCDDSHTYAIKRVQDHPNMPICEWVGHHLCRRCGILTPDFAVLSGATDAEPPSFGSRIASYSQIEHSPLSFEVSRFFRGHTTALAAVYALDAVVINPDRHGRNLFVRNDVAGDQLVAFDFSRAWLRTGHPFGNTESMRESATSMWWKMFKRMGASVDIGILNLLSVLDAQWLSSVMKQAPTQWLEGIDQAAILEFWDTRRSQRIDWASRWLT